MEEIKESDKSMVCDCCGAELRLFTKSKHWQYWKCPSCGFWTTRTLEGAFPSFEYNNYQTFDRDADAGWETMVNEAEIIMRHKFSIICKRGGGTFLDVGASEGVYVCAAARLGWDAHGFEVDREKVVRAQKRGLQVVELAYDNPAYQNRFDFIMFRHTLEHIPNFMDVLQQALPLLREDGVLCVETPNQESLINCIRGYKVRDERFLADLYPPTHINAFCRQSYEAVANTLRLDVAQCLTYSPGDPKWFGHSGYGNGYRRFKVIIHGLCARVGMGLNIAVFLKKRPAGVEGG